MLTDVLNLIFTKQLRVETLTGALTTSSEDSIFNEKVD